MSKLAIIHPANPSKTARRAVAFLSEFLLDFTFEYPFCYSDSDTIPDGTLNIYLGTKENNRKVKELSEVILSKAEQYNICVKESYVIIEGFDDAGTLYGVMDFYNHYLIKQKYYGGFGFKPEAPLPEFSRVSAPDTAERGIWTWGHVIYDYKHFLDNMAKLKMNSIIIWNDFVPFNIQEILDYAHELCIKVILGYPWGWDQRCREMSLSVLDNMSEEIFEKFERDYSQLDIDGIYFQSITELNEERIEGVLVAEAVTNFVNRTSALFYDKYPELLIEFGLHATSVKNSLEYIARTDKRVRIVWEDLGSMPFSYGGAAVENFDETLELALKTATLRGTDDNYGIVPKAMTCLDWSAFRHPIGAQNWGVSSKAMKENRIIRKRRNWRNSLAVWMINGDYALKMFKALIDVKGGNLSINVLIEDGMFEEQIMYQAALFSEMIWDCGADYNDLVRDVVIREYVEFV